MTDHTELRRMLEEAKPFVRPGGTDPATVTLLASDVLALLDDAENQDVLIGSVNHYKAERDALAAKLEAVWALVLAQMTPFVGVDDVILALNKED